ncbi:hypothetical protein MMC25_003082 [Agyrium rufum]|nr:hypothetical protein [Agyrium rufum]
MKGFTFLILLAIHLTSTSSSPLRESNAIEARSPEALAESSAIPPVFAPHDGAADYAPLEKRKGGGGGKGGGGSKGGGSSSGGGGGGSSSSSARPSYGGGKYYYGGATTAYASGSRSPLGITPLYFGAGALAFYPGVWAYGAYGYPYSHPYYYQNNTAPKNSQNQSLPVECLCAQYSACGCDDSGNSTYVDSLISNATSGTLDPTQAQVTNVNGTKTLVINGTLPNGTDDTTSAAPSLSNPFQSVREGSGYLVMATIIGSMVLLL